MKPNLTDLVPELAAFVLGDPDGDLAGAARFVYVGIDARNRANSSGKRFFNS